MGENLDIPGRRAVRSPMQWAPERSGGFSSAPPDDLRRPLPTGRYSPKNVNVVSQQNDPDSTLAWMKRLIRRRRSLPEIGLGEYYLIDVGPPEVLAIEYVWADRRLLTLHNLSDRGTEVDLGKAQADGPISSIWSDTRYDDAADTFEMAPNGYRWIRIGADHWFM